MDFSNFSRQSTKGFLVIFLINLKKQAKHLWVFIPIFLSKERSSRAIYLILIVLALFLLISLIKTIIRYKTFLFKVDNENFIVKEGFLKKKETIIPFHKIVNVNLKQDFVQQILELTQVEVETAGSDKLEIKIEALSKENAVALKEILIQNQTFSTEEEEKVNYLQKISVKELIKVAFTENHIQSFLLIIAFFISMYSKIEEYLEEIGFKEILISTAKDNKSAILNSIWIVFLASIISSLIVSFGRIFIKHFNLKTLIKNNAVEIKQGLFDYKNSTIKTSRVQYLKISTNPLKKLYGICNVSFLQASSGMVNLKKVIKTVGVTKNQLQKIIAVFYTKNDLTFSSNFIKPHPYYRNRMFFRALLILFVVNIVGFIFYNIPTTIVGFGNFVILCIITLSSIVRFKKASFNYNNTHIQVNSGFISTEKIYFEYFKIQKITLHQTYFQRRRNITDLYLQTASGDIKIPCINYEKAISMYNQFLYTVEKSTKKWM